MIDCKQVLTSLYAYLDNDLEQPVKVEIKTHIELCRACFGCLEFEQLLREHMKKKTYSVCPDQLKFRIKRLFQEFDV
jgi:mycothiol system anti-sigma-R factor